MNADTVSVSGVPGVADGVLVATITDAWFDAERTAHVVEVARRIERLHGQAARRLAMVCEELDEALEGHPLEGRLRDRLLWPLERDCRALSAIAEQVHVRLSLFAPSQSQEQFDRGMALQLADLQAAQSAPAVVPQEAAPTVVPMPFGYWISEDSFNRLERAQSAALLLTSVDERTAVPFASMAAVAAYVHDDLATVVASARHSIELEADDDAA